MAISERLADELHVEEDYRQQVVEIVGDAAGELPHGLHLLRLPQLGLQRPFARTITRDGHVVRDGARAVADGEDG